MSFDALAWAGKCQPGSASKKLVLLALCDRHNSESNVAYPSVAWLVEWTGLNRKTVISALSGLEDGGFISDSGKRYGSTKQIKAYSLNTETIPKTGQLKSPKKGIPKTEPLPSKSPVFTIKESQKRDTEPVREPVKEKKKINKKENPFPMPDWTDKQVWSDFLQNRRAKKCQNTVTAYKRFLADIEKHKTAEWPPPKLLEHAAAMGWAGIYPPSGRDGSPDARQAFLDKKYATA